MNKLIIPVILLFIMIIANSVISNSQQYIDKKRLELRKYVDTDINNDAILKSIRNDNPKYVLSWCRKLNHTDDYNSCIILKEYSNKFNTMDECIQLENNNKRRILKYNTEYKNQQFYFKRKETIENADKNNNIKDYNYYLQCIEYNKNIK